MRTWGLGATYQHLEQGTAITSHLEHGIVCMCEAVWQQRHQLAEVSQHVVLSACHFKQTEHTSRNRTDAQPQTWQAQLAYNVMSVCKAVLQQLHQLAYSGGCVVFTCWQLHVDGNSQEAANGRNYKEG